MALSNFYFLFFWGCVLLLLLLTQIVGKKYGKTSTIQKMFLLLGSYAFIGFSSWKFALELCLYTLIVFWFGEKIKKNRSVNRARWYLAVGVTVSIVFLCFFKYADFWADAFQKKWHTDTIFVQLILPLGISYYVFSGISYLVDVYKEKIQFEVLGLDFFLYMAFFPKISAGPIEKARNFIPQLMEYKGLSVKRIEQGVQIFVFGLFKKMVLADHLGVFVNDVFGAPSAYHAKTIVLAIISYSLQIYFDFSGYSDMAIGVAETLGISLEKNFNLPYIATNVSEFWKRWHISLSSWLQEYVYIPLGGSEHGEVRTYVNLILVMLISGIWHGNGATFLTWGLLYGITSCFYRIYHKIFPNVKMNRLAGSILNFGWVSILWVFFRASSLENALDIFRGIVLWQDGINQMYTWSYFSIAILFFATLIAYRKSGKSSFINGFYPIMDLSKFKNLFVFFTAIGLTIILGYYGNTAFIYGGF